MWLLELLSYLLGTCLALAGLGAMFLVAYMPPKSANFNPKNWREEWLQEVSEHKIITIFLGIYALFFGGLICCLPLILEALKAKGGLN